MKKSLLLFSLIVALSFSTKAQTSVYHPFPDSDAVWCCVFIASEGGCCFCGNVDYERHSTYKLAGKTLINGLLYNRMAHYDSAIDRCSPDTIIDTTTYYLRQDTSLKKVWFYNASSHTDVTFYDFNLQVGDTLDSSKVIGFTNQQPLVVSSIDSILLNGNYRKRYNFQSLVCGPLLSDTSIIEGIGSLDGLMYPPGCAESEGWLNAFIQNNLVLIGSIDTSNITHNCPNYFLLSTNENKKNISITFSPNPFHTTATLEIQNEELKIKNEELKIKNLELRIYDVMGRLVREQQIVNRNSEIVNRNGLPDGLYFYQLRTTDYELIATGKFVVE